MTTTLKPASFGRLKQTFRPLLLSSLLAIGCGGPPSDQPDLGSVYGTVTLDEKPLAGATVTFQPQEGVRMSRGVTDEDGYYELKYSANANGAVIDQHVVKISTYQAGDSYGDEGTSGVPEKVPVQYNRDAADNPEMNVEVAAGSNPFDWDLTSEGEVLQRVNELEDE